MKRIRILQGVLLILSLVLFPCSFAAQKSGETLEDKAKFPAHLNNNSTDKKRWNLQDVDIHNIIEQVAKETGKNFIVDPKVQGKASVISTRPMDSDELYQVFLSILQVLGFAAVETGDIVKIVPDASAKFLPAPLVGKDQNEPTDAVVVRVIPVENGNAAALIPVLRNLASPQGHLAAYAPSNAVIVADYAGNVERLADIIRRMDQEDTDGMEIIRLVHASAGEVANSLSAMITNKPTAGQPGGPQLTIAPDDRSNSIIISGDKKRRQQVRNLIARLDVPMDGDGNTEVIYLRYQKAEDMVPVLANILSSYYGSSAQSANAGSFKPPAPSATPRQKRANNSNFMSNDFPSGQSESNSSYFGGNAPFDSVPTERQAVGTVVGGYGVQAEPNTNALIITAPPSLMRNLKAVVAKLDVRRAQVIVEAIIAEVSELRNLDLGIEWRGQANTDLIGGTRFPHGTNVGPLDTLQSTYNQQNIKDGFPNSTTSLAGVGTGLTVGFIKGGSIMAVLRALENDNNVNLLSTPNLSAIDNSEAEIRIGDTVPFPIGQYATTGGTNTVEPFITKEYREVGLELRLKPQITKGNAIQLAIDLKADALGPKQGDDPTIINRSISTSVQVNDSEIIVLGGLIRTEENKNMDKIPFLGDIPLIGYAFRSMAHGTRKTNLMIFLRPTILREDMDDEYVTSSKYQFIREQQIWARSNSDDKQREREGVVVPWNTLKTRNIKIPDPFG
jgi:general secretion pathway protein D